MLIRSLKVTQIAYNQGWFNNSKYAEDDRGPVKEKLKYNLSFADISVFLRY